MKTAKGPILLIAGGATLLAILLMMPRVPVKVAEQKSERELKLDKAIELVNSGSNPMEGITILRELLQENPLDKDALWYLGEFSMKSGQYENAIGRYETLLKAMRDDVPETTIGPLMRMAEAYSNLENYEKSIDCLQKVKELTNDSAITEAVQTKINELKTIKN
ncbi:MAG: tetratricopeptide repeat protein [Flavobacteriales bacterium]